MALQQILEALATNLRCSICLEIFTDPVTSSCGKHNYCMKCLKPHLGRKARSCPDCREEFPKSYTPQKNVALCSVVGIVNRPTWEEILTGIDRKHTPFSVETEEFGDRLERNVERLKRKLTHLTSEMKSLEDVLSKKLKTRQQSPAHASVTKDTAIQGDFESSTVSNSVPEAVWSDIDELSQQALVNITDCLRVGQDCLSSAISQLEQVDVPSQEAVTGHNVVDLWLEAELPADSAPVAPPLQDAQNASEPTDTASVEPEGVPLGASYPQSVAAEPVDGAEGVGPSAGPHCLEYVSFSRELGHRNLAVSPDNRKVQVRRSGGASPLRQDRFDVSQVMAEQEFSSDVHYWEVNTAASVGWAIGVAYSTLGRGDLLGRTESSWCLEWSSKRLCFWHNNMNEPLKHGCPSKVRVLLDMDGGSLSFYSMSDHPTLLHCIQVQFTAPVRPVFWLFGLKSGNALSITVP
ncbi:E3 ubiquitin/ISG15 ligase TRIM25 [Megalops cyprinoides]|uniref:E3 ubiquitin/ISG15 ligase TRIM25 n=1 Tax=Megalops cyprinoides TaxID=118141 RepID=UPI001864286D|nr:E3 ubiquitin/ISG15 ligase TRIM25 [Megalops cyprinoides]